MKFLVSEGKFSSKGGLLRFTFCEMYDGRFGQ